MPDVMNDTELDNAPEEEMEQDDFGAGFESDDEGQLADDTGSVDEGDDAPADDEPGDEGGEPANDKGDGEPDKKPDDQPKDKKDADAELTGMDKLLAMADEEGLGDEPDAKDGEPDKKPDDQGGKPAPDAGQKPGQQQPAPQPQQPQGQPVRMTKEHVRAYIDAVPLSDILPEGRVTVGDVEVDFGEYADEFPEMVAATKVISGKMAEAVVNHLGRNNQLLTNQHGAYLLGKFKEQSDVIQQLQGQLANMQFWNKAGVNPYELDRNDEFRSWLSEKPKRIQKLADKSQNPESIRGIWDLFQTEQADKKAKEYDEKMRKAKRTEDGVHLSTLQGGGRAPGKRGGRAPEDEFAAGFEDED